MSVSCYEINIIIYSDSDTEWVKKLMVQQKQQITPPPQHKHYWCTFVLIFVNAQWISDCLVAKKYRKVKLTLRYFMIDPLHKFYSMLLSKWN